MLQTRLEHPNDVVHPRPFRGRLVVAPLSRRYRHITWDEDPTGDRRRFVAGNNGHAG